MSNVPRPVEFLCFTLLSVCLLPVGVYADEPEPEADLEESEGEAVEQAQEHFDQGASYYFEDEYSQAIVEFHKAQRAHPHPVFLYNIAMANVQLGQLDRARDAAVEAEAMDQPLPPENHARTVSIIAGVDSVDNAGVIAASIAESDSSVDEPPQTDQPETDSLFGVLGWTGIGAVALGAAGLGGMAVTNAQINDAWTNLEENGDELDDETYAQRLDDIVAMQTRGKVLLFGGAGLTAVGTTLLVVDLLGGDDGESEGVALRPSFRHPGIEATVRW